MQLLAENLISPVVLCFALGIASRMLRGDLTVPEPVRQGLSMYLLLAIGLKGGAALSVTPAREIVMPGVATLIAGVVTPITAFALMRWLGRMARRDAAAVAAHYGSVSVVTFIAAAEAARRASLEPEAFLPALVAMLEVPGIIVALLFAGNTTRNGARGGWRKALHEVLSGKSIVLLVGGLVIGLLCGPARLADVDPFFVGAFKGVLCLFMIDLGLSAGARLKDARLLGWRLPVLGCLVPVLHGLPAVALAMAFGISAGGAAVFGAMVASASYIAAPAAVRVALPSANPGYYLTLSLGITFPFNLALGIPLYLKFAMLLSSHTP